MMSNNKVEKQNRAWQDFDDLNSELKKMSNGSAPTAMVPEDNSGVVRIRSSLPEEGVVLFVDDEEANRVTFKYQFDDRFKIVTAASGEEAIQILKAKSVAVLITDHRMPGMTGAQLCWEVKARWPGVRRFMFSAYCDVREIVERGLAEAKIDKPWDEDQVVKLLSEALQQRKSLLAGV